MKYFPGIRVWTVWTVWTMWAGFSILGCASQAPPSGGPPDRIPPRVVSTVPRADSVSVGPDTVIEVVFSEAMDRKTVERSVFVSPLPASSPRLRWKGRRLLIDLEGGLAPDRTYRVSIGADGSDENRNKMTGSHDFTFSTGAVISQGVVQGRVRGVSGQTVAVAAYDVRDTVNPDPRVRAPYVTQTGAQGDFRFLGLDAGTYRVFAVGDRNQDQIFDEGSESLGIAAHDAELESDTSKVTVSDVILVDRDTSDARPVTARTVNNRRIRIKMDKAVTGKLDGRIAGKAGALEIVSTYTSAEDSSVVFLQTGQQVEGEAYRITIGVSGRDTTLIVKGDGRADTRAPRVMATVPRSGQSASAVTPIVLIFDEAMREEKVTALWASSDSTHSPPGSAVWLSPNRLTFEPSEAFDEGDVVIELNVSSLSDFAGNPPNAFQLAFKAIGEGNRGTVSGTAAPQPEPVRVEALDLDRDGPVYAIRISPGDTSFVIPGLLPGRYSLRAYIDSDDDGAWGPGTLDPFAFSEPLLAPEDTVEVRPRWETVMDDPFVTEHTPVLSEGSVP